MLPPGGTKGTPRAEREKQIVRAATAEFGVHGYAAGSLSSVADAVGISRTLIYQYFGSRDGLYQHCLEQFGEQFYREIHLAMRAAPDPAGVFIAALEAIFTALQDQRHAWTLLYDQTLPPESPVMGAARLYRRRIRELASKGTAELLRERGHDNATDLSALTQIWMGVVTSLVTWWGTNPEETAADMVWRCRRLAETLLA